MATDMDLLYRIEEIEYTQAHFRLASDGADGWANYVASKLLEHRQTERALLTEVVASLQRDFQETVKAAIETALARRIRGTHDPKAEYCANDLVAKDGASFVARRNNPGPCPGAGWQLLARQGARGVAGERGAPGRDAPRITGWVVDRNAYTVAPRFSDGSLGPLLELRELFEDDGAA
jgi:hypothetical protein